MRILIATILCAASMAVAAQESEVAAKIMAAMAADVRSDADVDRDRNRKPIETLEFFQLEEDMRVLELLPGGGWYTKLLAPTLRENGALYVALGTNNVSTNLLTQDGFDHVTVVDLDVAFERSGPFRTIDIDPLDFGLSDIDLVATFRNMHNFTAEGRGHINAATYKALRSGGLYGVIDHSRRHMEPMTNENRRRADVVEIISEVLQAGFELVDYSDLHYRPDDELRYEVGRKSVTGNSDRFTLLFRKP